MPWQPRRPRHSSPAHRERLAALGLLILLLPLAIHLSVLLLSAIATSVLIALAVSQGPLAASLAHDAVGQ